MPKLGPSSPWLTVVLLALSFGCRRTESAGRAPAPSASAEARRSKDVTVFAAASLREAFTTLGKKLEASHPGAHVILSFAGSQALRAQIEHGAPADVFASADQRHMQALLHDKRVEAPRLFARNELVVIVAKARSAELRDLESLPSAERIVLGAPEVPVGTYSARVLDQASAAFGADFRARVEKHVVSREPDVRQVLAKVSLGEADAGIVYRTDALAAKDKVGVVTIPSEYNAIAEYPVALTTSAPAPELGRAFVELLLSAEGQEVLSERGFLPASAGTSAP